MWTEIVSGFIAAAAGSGGVLAFYKFRVKNADRQEVRAIAVLQQRVTNMEDEIAMFKREQRIARRVLSDMTEINNATRLALVGKIFEINNLSDAVRYPDPIAEAQRIIKEVGAGIIGEQESLFRKAEAEERFEVARHVGDFIHRKQEDAFRKSEDIRRSTPAADGDGDGKK